MMTRHARTAREREGYRLLFDSHPLPMWVYDVDTLAFLAVNEATIERYGYSREEFLSMTITDIRPPEEVAALLDNVATSTAVRQLSGTWRHLRKDGSTIEVEIASSTTPFEGRRARLVVAHDVTERLRAEREAAKLQARLHQIERLESLGQLAGGVAHDFNNILSVIMNYTSFVAKKIADNDDDVRYDLNEIHRAAERAAGLTHQLLAFASREIVQPEVIDFNAAVAEAERLLRRTIGEHIDLRVARAPGLWRIKVDPGEIERVVVNLVVNARNAMPQGGTLLVETANVELDNSYAAHHVDVVPGRYARLAVSDTGTGMSAEVAARAFEPFFTTKPKGEGTGLGLATVYGIVKQAGGHVELYSEPGRGTTVKVYLPATEDGPAPAPRRVPAASLEARNETVLLVEDEEHVRAVVRRMLSDAGYAVLETPDPGEALRTCAEHEGPIHLLLSDMVMPGMSGSKLAGRVRALRPDIKVLYMSGYTQDALDLAGAPSVALVEKPFTEEALLRRMRETLDTPDPRSEPPGRAEEETNGFDPDRG